MRTLKEETRDLMEKRMSETVDLTARALGAQAKLDYKRNYPALVNHADQTRFAAEIARAISGDGNVDADTPPVMGGEDFSFMLNARPGAFIFAGIGEDRVPVHHPKYDFNDDLIPIGCSYWARLIETAMPIKN